MSAPKKCDPETTESGASKECSSSDDESLTVALAEAEAELAVMRVERDELRARVERLESSLADADDDETGAPAVAQISADPADAQPDCQDDVDSLRETLKRRERTALDLKKRLKQSEQRVRELKLTLRSWKHRVAPLAQQLNLQRELIRELRAKQKEARRTEHLSQEADDVSLDEPRLQ